MSANGNGNGNSRIHLLDHQEPKGPQRDAKGRNIKAGAKVEDVYDIVAAECAKVHEFYMTQIPPFVARMIQDALVSYGLVTVQANAEGAPTVVGATSGAAAGDGAPSETAAPQAGGDPAPSATPQPDLNPDGDPHVAGGR